MDITHSRVTRSRSQLSTYHTYPKEPEVDSILFLIKCFEYLMQNKCYIHIFPALECVDSQEAAHQLFSFISHLWLCPMSLGNSILI